MLVLDLLSTQRATLAFINPELTNDTVSPELKFLAAIQKIETYLLCKKAWTIYIDSNRKVSKIVIFRILQHKNEWSLHVTADQKMFKIQI